MSIESGDVFPDRLPQAISDGKLVLALIAPDWLAVTDAEGRRRLDDPGERLVDINALRALRAPSPRPRSPAITPPDPHAAATLEP